MPGAADVFREQHGSRREWLVAAVAALVAQYPILSALPVLFSRDAVLLGDGAWHALAARALARGTPHGWIAATDGGFPVGPYYPPGAWWSAALLIRLGCPAGLAVQLLGVAATIAIPLVFLLVARALGLRPLSALCGALVLAWVSPFTYFVASSVSFVFGGLISQSLQTLLLLPWLRLLLDPRPTRWLAPLAALMTVAHPQVTIASFLVVGAGIGIANSRWLWRRYLLSAASVFLVGMAMFGVGLVFKRIPLGWPQMESWRNLGFGPEMAVRFYAFGELLDYQRPPVLTAAWLIALIALFAKARQSVLHRAVLAASITAAILTVSGGNTLVGLVPVLTQALMPARMLAIVPLGAAVAIVVAADSGLAWLARWTRAGADVDGRRRTLVRAGATAILLIAGLYCSPGTAHEFYRQLTMAGAEGFVEASCTSPETGPFAAREMAEALRTLERGRLEIDAHAPFSSCRKVAMLPLATDVPTGQGSFPGIMMTAFANVRPWLPGSAARAETLGVRSLLRGKLPPGSESRHWQVIARHGSAELVERIGGTDTVGLGCVDEVWAGSNEALRDALLTDLGGAARTLSDPSSLVALEVGSGPMVTHPVERGPCSAVGASVRERPREPGAYEATVETPTPVDVVVRATDFATWRITVDGVVASKRTVAPGFFATRVDAGRHEIVAMVSPIPFYFAGLGLAFAGVVALAWRRC